MLSIENGENCYMSYFFKKFGMQIMILIELHVNISAAYASIPYYMCDDLCQKLETIFNHSVKGISTTEVVISSVLYTTTLTVPYTYHDVCLLTKHT